MTLYNLVYLSSNIFNLYITKNFYELFLEHNKEKCRRTILAYILYFIATSSTYLLFEIPLLNLFVNIICFFIISLCYEGSITKKIFTTLSMYGYSFVIEILSLMILGVLIMKPAEKFEYDEILVHFLSKILSFLIIFILKNTLIKKSRLNLPVPVLLGFTTIPVATIIMELIILGNTRTTQTISILSTLILLFINIVFFILFDSMAKLYEQKYENRIAVQERDYYYNNCIMMQKATDEVKDIYHDIENHLSVLHEFIKNKNNDKATDYIETITSITKEKFTAYSMTGNIVIDSIINYKLRNCSDNIQISVDNNVPPDLSMEIYDLSAILTNLLDNAIYAVKNFDSEKIIDIQIKYQKTLLLISVSNTYNGVLKYENNKIVTTKENAEFHGRGLRNVEKAIEKYDGLLTIEHDDKYFKAKVLLYMK